MYIQMELKQEIRGVGQKFNKKNTFSLYLLLENSFRLATKGSISYIYDRNHKIFKKMSEFVGSRDGIQCRSHHIKQLRTHKHIGKIIEL